jgi:hypothetical protein
MIDDHDRRPLGKRVQPLERPEEIGDAIAGDYHDRETVHPVAGTPTGDT